MDADKTQDWLQNRRQEIHEADYSDECKEAILQFLDAYDPEKFRVNPPIEQGKDSREDTLSASSRLAYASTLHRTATHVDLVECTATDLNKHADRRLNGTLPDVKDEGVSQNTVHQNQIAWRSFARFHQSHNDGHDINIDAEEIILVDREDTTVDERDMFDREEVQAMREVCRNKRDRAVLEMLIYTGQRHNALRMLEVRDVKPDEGDSGKLYLPDTEGMKGAEGKRPLLGAQEPAREWLQTHPTGEPDDAFFTHLYDWSGHDGIDPGDHLSKNAFGRITKRIADRAGVDKPANPHQFRHYFCHMLISNHNMSMDTVRHLLGHAADSRELERTYQHLVDEDYIENAELDMGIRDEREESLTPTQCFTCNEPLNPSDTFCANCGRQYGPDTGITDDIESRKTDGALAAVDPDQQEQVAAALEKLNDPAVLNAIINFAQSAEADSLEEAAATLPDRSK